MDHTRNRRILDECEERGEPAIVFRAQDRHALAAVSAYLGNVATDPEVGDDMETQVEAIRTEFHRWQVANGRKAPDLRDDEPLPVD
jgi:hypothetical protein